MEKKEGLEKNVYQNKEEKAGLLKISEISLMLDTYDDIFSDFDPRPFSERALSDDFLLEAKKASRDKKEKIALEFLIPSDKRDIKSESLIKKRLREHFRKHSFELQKEIKKTIKKGLFFIFFGVLIMFIATLVLFKIGEGSLFSSFLLILLEPAGWFLFWEGSNILIFESKKITPDFDFYKKMSKCRIDFVEY